MHSGPLATTPDCAIRCGRPTRLPGTRAGSKRGQSGLEIKFGALRERLEVAVNIIGDTPDNSHVHKTR